MVIWASFEKQNLAITNRQSGATRAALRLPMGLIPTFSASAEYESGNLEIASNLVSTVLFPPARSLVAIHQSAGPFFDAVGFRIRGLRLAAET